MTKVSVVTVCLNPGNVIAEAVKSVHAQDYGDVEHVIVDGGSRDGTVEFLKDSVRYGDVLISESDSGIFDAMNKGVAAASGDIIAILNADDHYASPHILSRVVAEFERAEVDAVLGDVTYFRPGHPERSVRRYTAGWFSPSRLKWGLAPAHAAMILTRDAYRRVGRYSSDFSIAGDFEYAVRAFHRHGLKYSYLPEVFVRMQIGGASTTAKTRKGVDAILARACQVNGIASSIMQVRCRYLVKAAGLV